MDTRNRTSGDIMKVKAKIVDKAYVYCPVCDNNKELEVVIRSHNHNDIEICVCGWPEHYGYMSVEVGHIPSRKGI